MDYSSSRSTAYFTSTVAPVRATVTVQIHRKVSVGADASSSVWALVLLTTATYDLVIVEAA